jgi:hypothetical protein
MTERRKSERKKIGSKIRRARIRQLRELYGDNCLHCGEPMLFDDAHVKDPRYRTIEHWPVPYRICQSNELKRLRLAHQHCNVEDDLKSYVAEGQVPATALARYQRRIKTRLTGAAAIAAPSTSGGAASQPARQPEGE